MTAESNETTIRDRRYNKMRIVIIGAGGRVGGALMGEYRDKFDMIDFDHEQLDIGDKKQIDDWLLPLDFDVLINAAAFTNVDLCETQRDQAFRINSEAQGRLAEICRGKKARLIHFSTVSFLGGKNREPYVESDLARPISVYGES